MPIRRTARVPSRPSAAARAGYTPWLYLAPGLVLYAAFLLFPLGRAMQYSLYEWSGFGAASFVGASNYLDMVGDEQLRAALWHALALIVFYALIPVVLGLLIASRMRRTPVRGVGVLRTLIFLPQVIALVVVAVAWRQIFAPDGPLNQLLTGVGLSSWTRGWLGDYTWALPSVGVIGTWLELGLVTILLLAGMSRIPDELYEAARLDGANAFHEFFAVTLPAVRGEVAVALTLTIIAALKTFDLVYITTSGGPGHATTVPSYEVYRRAFELKDVGSATALGVTLAVLIFVINLGVNRIGERD